ncbi:myoglobin [Erpetoichthys calabaricus]|uniref:Myoglobin n=1 Tax=Erpetoichthys calabaricus TaxID=27687 RepID=A0A8C4TDS2_ERPCA|nr:myoglobin [Erpetoichthys calabaricus]URH10244.1 myoglobin [Erpetoichthys calabaricus]
MAAADFDAVLASWGPVEADSPGYGEAVLVRLFTDHPESQKLFPKFKNLSQGELSGNAGIKAHGNVVLSKLTALIKQKGDHAALLKPLAESHALQHKIPRKNFEIISEVIVKVVAEKNSAFNADAQAALRRVLKVVVADLGCFYDEHGYKE